MRCRTAWCLSALLVGLQFVGAGQSSARDTGAFETAPVLRGAELAPEALLRGPLHTVAEPVVVEGYFGQFVIESRFGKFSVNGERMLAVRVHELSAIEALQNVQEGQAFKDALLKSASSSVQFVQSAVTNPTQTVENVAQGLGSVLGRIGFLAKTGVDTVVAAASNQAPTSSTATSAGAPSGFNGDPFGYNKARREWAMKLNIDPYTSNPVLKPLLDKAAAATFAGTFAVDTALGAVSRPVNVAVEMDKSVRDDVWNQPPLDLARSNESKLLAMGVSASAIRDFQHNTWFTPSLQTALVTALARLGNLRGSESVIQVASQVQGETRVRFLLESVQMLGRYQQADGRFVSLRMNNMVPIGMGSGGVIVAAVAIDYAYWDKEAAEFVRRKDTSAKRRVLLIAGGASALARKELARSGFLVRAGYRQ